MARVWFDILPPGEISPKELMVEAIRQYIAYTTARRLGLYAEVHEDFGDMVVTGSLEKIFSFLERLHETKEFTYKFPKGVLPSEVELRRSEKITPERQRRLEDLGVECRIGNGGSRVVFVEADDDEMEDDEIES